VIDLHEVYRRSVTLVGRVHRRASFVATVSSRSRWEDRALSEALISDLWQIWNEFVRQILLASCSGCTTRSGIIVAARRGDNSWQRVSYEARQHAQASKFGKRARIGRAARAAGRYQDPTWGDLDTLVDVTIGLAPSNAGSLSTAFGATSRGLKDLQTVRNACFHKNEENWATVKSLEGISFSSSDTRDPSELAWKMYLGKSTAAIFDWTDAVMTVCGSATR
jgi:hypothetical protein